MVFNFVSSDVTRSWLRRMAARKRAIANIVELAHLRAHLVGLQLPSRYSRWIRWELDLELEGDAFFFFFFFPREKKKRIKNKIRIRIKVIT